MNRSCKTTINLVNCIIGASILAMPFCFQHCGIVQSIILVAICALLNQFSCYLLLKSAIINRRRNYELLAYDVFGSSGKTFVEVCTLLYLLGTCVAFFVIVGDVAPSLISLLFNIENTFQLRIVTLGVLSMFIILPLGLLRNVDNLTSFSFLSLLVYSFFALRMFSLAFDKFVEPSSDAIVQDLTYWDSSSVISVLPIFSMAFSCQTQLFEVFDSDLFQADNRSLKFVMQSVKRAIYITMFVYIGIGFFGYVAFYKTNLTGNILQDLPSGFGSQLTLAFFLTTLLTSFPLLLFPCRTSLHSLMFRKGAYNDFLSTAHSIHMSDRHFKTLTIVLIMTTMGISVIFPHVEFVLALLGSTIGAVICFIFPAVIFIKLMNKNTVEYLLSYLLLIFGLTVLIFCTLSVLFDASLESTGDKDFIANQIKFEPVKKIVPFKNEFKPLPPGDLKSRISNINKIKKSLSKVAKGEIKILHDVGSPLPSIAHINDSKVFEYNPFPKTLNRTEEAKSAGPTVNISIVHKPVSIVNDTQFHLIPQEPMIKSNVAPKPLLLVEPSPNIFVNANQSDPIGKQPPVQFNQTVNKDPLIPIEKTNNSVVQPIPLVQSNILTNSGQVNASFPLNQIKPPLETIKQVPINAADAKIPLPMPSLDDQKHKDNKLAPEAMVPSSNKTLGHQDDSSL